MQLGLKGMGKLWKKTGDVVKKVPDNLPTMGFSKARCSRILGVKITPPKAKNTDNIVSLPSASKVDDVSKKIAKEEEAHQLV